ncbi:MAG: outer membrane beta-barrel family protein, partial [Bacteroidota bacterium]|nr:outer membrane beta-barrel family protein [Bacteroidota bacterium]
ISSNYTALSMDNDYMRFDPKTGVYIEDESKKIRQTNNQLRNRLYGSFSGMLWDINYSLGLSLENKSQENKEMVSSDNYSSNFLTLLPGINFLKRINENHSLSFSYNRFSSYPENRHLNPHADYSDSTNIEIGNPDLKPYYTDSYSASYSYSLGEQYIGVGANYFNNTDIIEQITTQINSKTALTTYKNVSSNKSFVLSVNAGEKFFDWLFVQPFISLSESKYNSQYSNNKNRSWSGNLLTAVSFSNFKFQLSQRYSSSSMSAQEKSKSLYFANAMMKALFFNRALSLSLKVEDLFNTRNRNVDRYGTGFYSVNNVRQKTRILSLDISYYFMSKASDNLEDRPDGDQYGDDF